MKNILKSKIVLIFIAVVILLLVISQVIETGERKQENIVVDPVEVSDADARTVIPFGKYDEIEMFDSEKGIFLASAFDYNKNYYSVDFVNNKGEVIKSYNDKGYITAFSDKHIVLMTMDNEDFNNDKYYLTEVNLNSNEEPVYEEYKYADINSENGDIIIEEKDDFKVMDEDKKEIFKLSKKILNPETNNIRYRVKFVGEDYIAAENKDTSSTLYNYRTGEKLYTSEKSQEVLGKAGGKWVVYTWREDSLACYNFLNEDFTPAFDGCLCNEYIANDKYIGFATMDKSGVIDSKDYRIYDKEGNLCEFPSYGTIAKGFAGDIGALSKPGSVKVNYVHMAGPEKGKRVRMLQEVCYMDFEDGVALSCKAGDAKIKYSDNEWSESYGYVDKNFKPLTDYVFQYGTPSENGYAVVGMDIKKKSKMAVIDFNKERE